MNITLYNLYDQKICNIFIFCIIYYLFVQLIKYKKYNDSLNDKLYELEETNKLLNKKINENIKLLFDFEKTIIDMINNKITCKLNRTCNMELKEPHKKYVDEQILELEQAIYRDNNEYKKHINHKINKLKEEIIDSINLKKSKESNIPYFTPVFETLGKFYNNKRQIEFIDLNIHKIHFNYRFMKDENIEIYYSGKLYLSNNYSDIIKFINLLKQINIISIDILKSDAAKYNNLITLIEIKQFDIIKEICKINENVKLEINIHATNYQFNNLQYLFSDIKHENITNIDIKYNDLIIDVNNNFNENISKKIMLISRR